MSAAIPQRLSQRPHNHNPIARARRALFGAWGTPAAGSPTPLAMPSGSKAAASSPSPDRDPGGDVDPAQLPELPPAPLYFAYDDAETFMLRLLEESVAAASDVEERDAGAVAPVVAARATPAERRAS